MVSPMEPDELRAVVLQNFDIHGESQWKLYLLFCSSKGFLLFSSIFLWYFLFYK